MKLEELVKGVVVEGVEPDAPVTVVNVDWNGDDSVELFYKKSSGAPGSQLLYRFDEPRMQVVGGGGGVGFRRRRPVFPPRCRGEEDPDGLLIRSPSRGAHLSG